MKRYKYPRTTHIPWSPGASHDDIQAQHIELSGDVVITEKMDGENTTLYCDGLHARSIDSRYHPSRAWIRAYHGQIAHLIPNDFRICGENLYAKHSIHYTDLQSFFYVFSIWEGDLCLSWDDTVEWAELLGLSMVPLLYRGEYVQSQVRTFHEQLDLKRQEGYVLRTSASFLRSEFSSRVVKWVRRNHVQTDTHWMHQKVIPNKCME